MCYAGIVDILNMHILFNICVHAYVCECVSVGGGGLCVPVWESRFILHVYEACYLGLTFNTAAYIIVCCILQVKEKGKSAQVVKPEWLWKCIKSGKRVPTEAYRPA